MIKFILISSPALFLLEGEGVGVDVIRINAMINW